MQKQRISPIFILLQLSLVFLHEVISVPFQPVSTSCIYWDPLKIYSNGHSEKLHCIMDEKGQLGIVNVTWKLVPSGNCPYFDRYSGEVNVKPCDEELGRCPEQPIYSYQAVKYAACYSTQLRNESHLTTKDSDVQDTTTPYPPNTQYICKQFNSLLIINTVLLISLLAIDILRLVKIQQKKSMKRERRTKDGNGKFRIDVNSKERNGHGPLLERRTEDGNGKFRIDVNSEERNGHGPLLDKDELMNLCLRLVKVQFENQAVDLGGLATDISENEKEQVREKLQKALNGLSTNTY